MPNSLINEQSPYLKQHANNPVNWYPWTKEAFEKAKAKDKMIFLSIGYSACHWCHVMEIESFENKEIASLLNRYFISIKVDKEERPDIDRHFQDVFITMNGRAGGWPLSIFMTYDKTPLYSATYIPPKPQYGMMGFAELLELLANRYKNEKENMIKKGQEVLAFMQPKQKIEATKIDNSLETRFIKQIESLFDSINGGFGSAPKFPHTSTLRLAMRLYKLGLSKKRLKNIVTHTLYSMSSGGMYDLVDGGFCRYSTDSKWLIPHFEKMLYDNALLSEIYLEAWHIFGIDRFKNIAFEILEYLYNKMQQNNLYFSASDADSNDGEGGYYIYNYEEIKELFDKEGFDNSSDLLKRLGFSSEGNFESRNVVRVENIDDFTDKDIQKAINLLAQIRKSREYPTIDKKILTSWNAMVIRAMFKAGRVESKYTSRATESLKALEKKMSKDVKLYHSALIDATPTIEGFLEDYSYLISALLEGYQTTLNKIYLIRATNLANEAIKKFYNNGRWKIGNGEFQDFVEDTDGTFPSPLAVMAENLLTLRSLVEPVYEKFVYRTIELHSYELMRQPISRPLLSEVAIRKNRDDMIIKAQPKLLQKHISHIDTLPYPWVFLRTTLEDNYQLCSNSGCFANSKEFEDIEKELKKVTKLG